MSETTDPKADEKTPAAAETATVKAASKAKSHPVGTTVEVEDGVQVLRPDESLVTVSGTRYVLDVPGTHRIGDRDVIADAAK